MLHNKRSVTVTALTIAFLLAVAFFLRMFYEDLPRTLLRSVMVTVRNTIHISLLSLWIISLNRRLVNKNVRRLMLAVGGLLALLAGRFLAFVRTLLPTMAGISGLPNRRFQFFNWLSGLLWVSVVTSFGYALSMIPFVKRHEDQVMTFLMILPIALLTAGLLGTLFVVIKKKYCNA